MAWVLPLAAGWGCTADVYVPSSHPTPQFEQQGDVSGALYASVNGTDAAVAYAVHDHFGVGAAGNYLSQDYRGSSDFKKHKYAEISLIYRPSLYGNVYRPLDGYLQSGRPRNAEQPLSLTFLASAGLGEGEELRNGGDDEAATYRHYASGRYSKISLQSNIAITTGSVTAGLSPRLSYVSYHDLLIRQPDPGGPASSKRRGLFWEPGLFVNLHYDPVTLEAQMGGARMLGQEPAFNYDTFFISAGLKISLNILK